MYPDDLLNIENPYLGCMINQTYSPKQQLNIASTTYIEAPFLDLHLSNIIAMGFASCKTYNKRDDF